MHECIYSEDVMKTYDTKHWCNVVIALAALLVVLFPLRGAAGPMGEARPLVEKNCFRVRTRPLSDFLQAQGTLNAPPQFFPPVKDYGGWNEGNAITLLPKGGVVETRRLYLPQTGFGPVLTTPGHGA
jgi:hypothetical protein